MTGKGRIFLLGDAETWDKAFSRLRETTTGRKRDVRPLPEVKTLAGGDEAITPDQQWGMVKVEGEGWDLINLPAGEPVAINLSSLDACRRRILETEGDE